MEIIYTSKAKNDLAHIHWKTREKIIFQLESFNGNNKARSYFVKVANSDLIKMYVEDHVVIGALESKKELNVLSIVKKQKIKIPEISEFS